MKLFYGYRPNPPEGYKESGLANDADEPQYQGVVFDDGSVALRWMTSVNSTSMFETWSDFYTVHGHPEYGTRVDFTLLEYEQIISTENIDEATDF